MKADVKIASISSLLLLLMATSLQARDYVPPPSGPYQSSVIINSATAGDAKAQKVYKFPPADITLDAEPAQLSTESAGRSQMSTPDEQRYPQDRAEDQSSKSVNTRRPMPSTVGETPQWSSSPQAPGYPNPGQGGGYQWYGYQPQAGGYYQDRWSQYPQGYGYQNPYPYRGENPYDYSTNPFESMPSPWSIMPKNPFFTDK